jgi:trichohyalin
MDYFDYGLDPESDTGIDIEDVLEQSQESERDRLEKDLERVEELLEDRDRIHEEAIDELESKLDWYLDRLETLYQRPGREREKRDRLKRRIEKFYEEIREEKTRRWRDRQELEMERRELLRAIEELDDTAVDELL